MTTKKVPAGTQFENKVRGSLRRIGFKDVAGGPKFFIGGIQVDAVGGWDDVLLVIEATHTSKETKPIRNRILEFKGESNSLRKGFKESNAYRAYKRLEFAMVTKGYSFSKADQALAESPQKIHLLDYQFFEYYQKLAGLIGKQPSLFNLLGELGVTPHDQTVHRTPAFKVAMQKNLVGYLLFCEPQRLLEIAYVARRETGRKAYYQRMLTSSRLKNIRDFINAGGVFANNVILAFDDSPQFKTEPMPAVDSPSWLEWGVLTFPKSYRAAWIIDGQHRLYAFGGSQSVSKLQKLPVFAFEQLDPSKQAEFFIEINREQKPVDKDLIWDIESDLRRESHRGRIALTVKRLNQKGPLKDRIYFPLLGDVKRGKIPISSICYDIDELRLSQEQTKNMTQTQRNPLTRGVSFERRINRVADGIADFLEMTLAEKEAEAYREDVILKPGGITLVLHVYEQVLIKLGVYPKKEDLTDYATAFVTALDDVVEGRSGASNFGGKNLTSYAQRRDIIVQILSSMRALLNDQNFGQGIDLLTQLDKRAIAVERKLAKLVANTLEIGTMKDLRQRAPEKVWKEVQRRSSEDPSEPIHMFFSLGNINQVIERQNNRQAIMDKLTSTFRDPSEVLAALKGLMDLRNPMSHGRKARSRQLERAYLSAFEEVLADV